MACAGPSTLVAKERTLPPMACAGRSTLVAKERTLPPLACAGASTLVAKEDPATYGLCARGVHARREGEDPDADHSGESGLAGAGQAARQCQPSLQDDGV